ncbi:MAG: hypothetical protein AAFX01_05620 [Cyanobacteria bacterium J06638_28]
MTPVTEPRIYLWTRDEYYRLAELNFLQERRVALIEGQVPDIAVVPGTIRDYADAHPTMAIFIVEVADSSLRYDRTVTRKPVRQSRHC